MLLGPVLARDEVALGRVKVDARVAGTVEQNGQDHAEALAVLAAHRQVVCVRQGRDAHVAQGQAEAKRRRSGVDGAQDVVHHHVKQKRGQGQALLHAAVHGKAVRVAAAPEAQARAGPPQRPHQRQHDITRIARPAKGADHRLLPPRPQPRKPCRKGLPPFRQGK